MDSELDIPHQPPPAPPKTADRPHNITILLAVISPLLALVAVVVSLISLRISQQNLAVGQRAYLSISIYELKLENPTELNTFPVISYKGEIKNLGNTPAIVMFDYILAQLKNGELDEVTRTFRTLELAIGAKEGQVVNSQDLQQLQFRTFERGLFGYNSGPFVYDGVLPKYSYSVSIIGTRIVYTDVFGERHTLNSCSTSDATGATLVRTCDDKLATALARKFEK